MDLDAKPYRAFVAVAEERSFGRAAARLNVSQPALSAQIREFERRIGFALFQRTSRSVELTAQGRLFLGNARRMVAETEGAALAARAIRTNQLTIGAAIETVLVPERVALLERFLMRRPDIPLRITNDTNGRHLAAVARREIDLALLVEPMLGAAPTYSPLDVGGAVAADLERLILGRRRIEILVPREHPASRLAVLPRSVLDGLPVVTFDRTHGIALTDAIGRFLHDTGANIVRAPERNALAVERYGAVTRTPAMSLGWFGRAHLKGLAPVVSRPVEGLEAATGLTLLRAKGEERPAATAFWAMAAESTV